jgi:hypothetical protein
MITTLIAAALIALAPMPADQPDPFSQDAFPCQEDEVLGYAPQFGPDKVGCIHIDELTR